MHLVPPIAFFMFVCMIWQLPSDAVAQSVLPLQTEKKTLADKKYHTALATKDSILLADAYYEYGKVYKAAGDYAIAQRWYLKALRILAPRGDSWPVARLYLRLADVETALDHQTEAQHYRQKALAVSQRARSERGIALAYGSLSDELASRWYSSRNPTKSNPLYDTVWQRYNYVRRYYQRQNDTLGLAEINASMGSLLLTAHDRNGFAYLEKSYQAYRQLKRLHAEVDLLQIIAKAWLRFGEPDKAWPLLNQAQRLYTHTGIQQDYTERHFAEAYITYYKAKQDYRNVAAQLEKLQIIARREAEADRIGAISRLNIEYETENKETLLKSQQTELSLAAENRRVQLWFLVAVSVLFLLATVASVLFFRLYRQNQRISQLNAELVREQNHRVKNNLQVLSSLLSLQADRIENEPTRQALEDSQLRVETMALLQRRLYEGDRLASVPLDEFLTDLVAIILQIANYDHVETEFSIPSVELDPDTALRLALIVNELITNACKYAFPEHPNPIFQLVVNQVGQKITLTVKDNGPGLPLPYRNGNVPHTFGLNLIQMQVAQLNGHYWFNADNGTQFSMHFNLH